MRSKLLFIIIAGLVVAACTKPNNSQNVSQPSDPPSTDQEATTSYTKDDVAKHNQESDCWLIIDDQVYDVTEFISLHPGGKIIAMACGKDASILYHARGPRKENHSQRADKLRQDYFIGTLKAEE